jgi:hypothetical protein
MASYSTSLTMPRSTWATQWWVQTFEMCSLSTSSVSTITEFCNVLRKKMI